MSDNDQAEPIGQIRVEANGEWILKGWSTKLPEGVHWLYSGPALAAPAADEPVAWMYERDGRVEAMQQRAEPACIFRAQPGWTETPLYAHPPAAEPVAKHWAEVDAHRDLSRIIPDMETKIADAKKLYGHCLPKDIFAPLEMSITELRVLRHEVAHPLRDADADALNGYRAAVSWISADSWDGCSDCIAILRKARTADWQWDWAGDPQRIALELKALHARLGEAALATPARTDDAAQAGGDVAAMREALKKIAALRSPNNGDYVAIAERALAQEVEPAAETLAGEQGEQCEQCERCCGNGELVTDWERYLHAHEGDVGDEAVADCPDCNGTGRVEPAAPVKRDLTSGEECTCLPFARQEGDCPRHDMAEKLMRDFYLSSAYNPKAERHADVVKEAIAFTLSTQAAYPTGAGEGLPDDVVSLVVAGREAWETLQDEHPAYKVTVALGKVLERFASRVCYDDEGGELPEAHASPCTCGRAPVKEGE